MTKNIFRRLLSYMAARRGMLVLSFACALCSVPLALLGPVFIGQAVDAVVGPGDVDFKSVFVNLCLLIAAIAASCALQWLMQICTRKISAYTAQEMRRQAFAKIDTVPLSRIDRHSHGDLVSRLVNDADAVAEGVMQGLTQLLPGIITVLATLMLMLTLNVWIALLVVIITPLSILFARVITRRTGVYFIRQSQTQGKVSGYVGEMVNNQSFLAAFGYEETSEKEFEAINEEYFKVNFKATLYSSIVNPGARFVNSIVYAAVAVLGALLALEGAITVGGISAFLAYANQYTKPFNEITSVLTQLQSAFAGAQRLFEVMDWENEVQDEPDALSPPHSAGRVEAKDVFFSYTPQRPLIRDFSFLAQPGQRFALVGPAGCGKTTIINLLMRFYEVDSGRIAVDGHPIDAITRDALRNMYGMVLQETWLKRASVRENIAYGCPDASDEEIEAAARSAYAHRFIRRLPNGYETVIDNDSSLSEGQKQLLCIARVMLSRPDMLILDEATSSIDTRTEMLIQKALEKLMEGHTSFIVAHRLSTIQNADMILMMDAGRIIERGTHEELLAQNGAYAHLFNSQFAVQAGE